MPQLLLSKFTNGRVFTKTSFFLKPRWRLWHKLNFPEKLVLSSQWHPPSFYEKNFSLIFFPFAMFISNGLDRKTSKNSKKLFFFRSARVKEHKTTKITKISIKLHSLHNSIWSEWKRHNTFTNIVLGNTLGELFVIKQNFPCAQCAFEQTT